MFNFGAHGFHVKSVSPQIKYCNYVTLDYSHILHVFFCGCFLLLTPLQKRDFALIIRYKVTSLNFLDDVCVIRRNRSEK